jgi:hypothetical protein
MEIQQAVVHSNVAKREDTKAGPPHLDPHLDPFLDPLQDLSEYKINSK